MRRLIFLPLLLATLCLYAANQQVGTKRVRYKDRPAYIFRVYLSNKQESHYSIDRPGRFLSKRAIERRRRQGLQIDSTDLPVTPRYLRLLNNRQVTVIGQSRWNNTALVRMQDSSYVERIRQLPFVTGCRLVWQAPDSVDQANIRVKVHERFNEWDSIPTTVYGRADDQIHSLAGHRLHSIGCQGEGMWIAVLDGGFRNVDKIPALQKTDIRGTRDLVYPFSPSVYTGIDHGTKVLSTMATNEPFFYIGTAPKASYWLLRCEDPQSEQEVEEDYWVMAAELADSIGCDIISSSLGYNDYDNGQGSHRLWQLDGQSTLISHSASMVASKGMILVSSAGNTGMGPWKKLTFPADAAHCLTVGAVTTDLTNAPFSAVGPTQDGRVKPDVVAIGSPATVVTARGTIAQDMGTSFSTPVVAGLVACLWQALPEKSALEIMEIIRMTSNNHEHPDNISGYGVPNFWKAYMTGKALSKLSSAHYDTH